MRHKSDNKLYSLLVKWAATEPQRCRQQDDNTFHVQYLGEWLHASAETARHGAIIAAVLGGCQENEIYCAIEYTPGYEKYPAEVHVGCIHKMFRYQAGEDVIASLPVLLLTEYLERLINEEYDEERDEWVPWDNPLV